MGTVKSTVFINAPQERVFELASDISNAEKNISAIRKIEILTEGPVGVGTRWRETRIIMKKEATEEMEITAFDPPHSLRVEAESCGTRYITDIRCVSEGDGARLEFEMGWKPLSFVAKLMTPIGFLMQGMLRKCIEKDLEELKAVAEAGATAAAAPA